MKYSLHQLIYKEDFEDHEEFVKVGDLVKVLQTISNQLSPIDNLNQIKNVRNEIERMIEELKDKN